MAINRQLLPLLALTTAMLLWGSSFVAMKWAFQSAYPMLVIWGRMVIAGIVVLPFLKLFWKYQWKKGDGWLLALLVLFEPCLYFTFETLALVRTSASQAGTITAKKLTERYNPFMLTTLQAWAGILFFLPFWVGKDIAFSAIPPATWGSVAYLGIAVTLLAYGLYNLSLQKLPASKVALFVNLIPVFTIAMAVVLFDEKLTGLQWVGALLILSGVIGATWKKQ